MTISSALSNALAGLTAAGRSTEIIAANISNATTPGYAKRSVELSSTSANLTGGVTVGGVVRHADPALTNARRGAEADMVNARATEGFLTRLESSLGTPDDPGALTNMIAQFDAGLLAASSRPDSIERLEGAVLAAKDLVDTITTASRDVSRMRSEADASIDAQVSRLNSALQEMETLNARIAQFTVTGKDTSSLQDIRQSLVDEINEIVPVREAKRENGKVALYSQAGAVLIDGSAREFEFTRVNTVTPHMTLGGGTLSGLTMDGRDIRITGSNSDLPGGTLAAQFAIRDDLGPEALSQLDAIARDLVERFQDPAVDPTLGAGDAGLFTDGGVAFDPLDEVGLSERLSVNPLVDRTEGGEAWRLRDGIGAAGPGAVGQAALIDALRDTLSATQVPVSGDFGGNAISFADLASTYMSQVGIQRLSADQGLTFAAAAFQEMSQAELAAGVDTDAELQNLIVVEQAYAANARMIQVVEEMMDALMRIGQ